MNNKGQSLIIFILLLPLITLFLAFFIDSSLSIMEKDKIDGVITSNMEESLKNNIQDIEKITSAINKNIDGDVFVLIENDTLKINYKDERNSLFAKVLNFSWYKLEFNYCGDYQNKIIDKDCG